MADVGISMVLNRLVPIFEREKALLLDSTEEVKKLASSFSTIREALEDAERRSITDGKVRKWLDTLRDLAYEIDDSLDELEWDVMRGEYDNGSDLNLFFFSLCCKRAYDTRKVKLNIRNLNERIDKLSEETSLDFVPNYERRSYSFLPQMSDSSINFDEFVGRDSEIESLLENLLKVNIKNKVAVIGMVGPGGMGKTTLAQRIFNDDRVKSGFEKRIWICVSQSGDATSIAKSILYTLRTVFHESFPLPTLVEFITGELCAKNFLLVLDDVWETNFDTWTPLWNALNYGGPKSKILVTTRNTRVTQKMGAIHTQLLQPLPETSSWDLFSQVAFCNMTDIDSQFLKATGLQILRRCKGFPLAAKVIGNLLSLKPDFQDWQRVLENDVWQWKAANLEIFSVLALSYKDLAPPARRCFSYCAIFPKNEWINVEILIRTWSAQGFLCSGDIFDEESTGREIFNELAARCFFHDFVTDIRNCVRYCKMHDIIHDFAQFLTRNECLILEEGNVGEVHDVLHLRIHGDHFPVNEKYRSFFMSGHGRHTSSAVPSNLLCGLKSVRVLVLRYFDLDMGGLGRLIHLTYLDLTGNPLKQLPKAICNLYNLETLILVGCIHLSALPQGMNRLRKLKHFLNDGTFLELSEDFKGLVNLQTLSNIYVAPSTTLKNLEILRNLNKLVGCLSIYVTDMENATDVLVEVAEKAELRSKHLLQELYLFFGGRVQLPVLEALKPDSNLTSLTYSGPHLPNWLSTLSNLRELTLVITKDELGGDTGSFSSLPPLGKLLPVLEVLWLCRMVGLKSLTSEFLGINAAQPMSYSFSRLKRLSFTDCKEWEIWEDISHKEEKNNNISIFPSLQCMEIFSCRKLQKLPRRILQKASSLKYLVVDGCDALSSQDGMTHEISQPQHNYRNKVLPDNLDQVCIDYLDLIRSSKLTEQLW